LWQQLWDLGRCLFIASTDPDAPYPPHLQGIWTGTWQPPWFGCYTNDENVQMMHWQAVAGNLGPMLQPLRRLLADSRPQWQDNARQLFGCGGVLAPLQQGGSLARHQQAEWQGWTGGAGWLACHLWDAWLLDGDPALLWDELLPLLDDIIRFYRDFLEEWEDGLLHALPSVSVENHPQGWPSRWTIDATMEIAIIREVLRHGCAAARAAGQEEPAEWRTLLERLPAYRINAEGELAEWIHPDHGDQHQHRHLSHLYPLFPGDEFAAGPSELRSAAGRALVARLETGQRSQTGWSLVHLAHLHARLGDGESAVHCLERLLRTCVQDNLLTVHDDWRGQGLTLGNGER
jgi:alpha-L-fucosidase 2